MYLLCQSKTLAHDESIHHQNEGAHSQLPMREDCVAPDRDHGVAG